MEDPECNRGTEVASSREDAWIETTFRISISLWHRSRPPARTRGLKQIPERADADTKSRPPARTRGLKLIQQLRRVILRVASSREDAWIETAKVASEIEYNSRVLPRGRVD